MNWLVGIFKYCKYFVMQRRYKFEKWHISPIEFRQFGIEICSFVNSIVKKEDSVYEIGCGLGEILSRINVSKKAGYDIDKKVIRAGKTLFSDIDFHYGSFEDVKGKDIDVLIAVDFLHNYPSDWVDNYFKTIIANNKIRYIVVDSVYTDYKFDFSNYTNIWQKEFSTKYDSTRTLYCYKL